MSEIHHSTNVPKISLNYPVSIPEELLEDKSNVEQLYYKEFYKDVENFKKDKLVYIEAVVSPDNMSHYREAAMGVSIACNSISTKMNIDTGYWLMCPEVKDIPGVIKVADEIKKDFMKSKKFLGICLYALGNVIDVEGVKMLSECDHTIKFIVDEIFDINDARAIIDSIKDKDEGFIVEFISGRNSISDVCNMDALSAYLQFTKDVDCMMASDRMKQGMMNIMNISLISHHPDLKDRVPMKEYTTLERRI